MGARTWSLLRHLRHLKDPGKLADELLDRFSLTDAGPRKGVDIFGWHAPSPRHRDEPCGQSGRSSFSMSRRQNSTEARIEVWQAVEELAEHGTTVLLTTHYLR